MRLPIEHITQQGNGWSDDCGPADVLMYCRALGVADTATVRWIAERVDKDQNGTIAADLVRAFALFGVTASVGVTTFPRIEIIDYGLMPKWVKAPDYTSSTFLHWILRESATVYLDPLFTNPTSGRISIDPAILERAHASGLARAKARGFDCRSVGVVESSTQLPTEDTMPTGKTSGRAIVRWNTWNVRATPDVKDKAASGEIEGEIYGGDQFTVLRELTNAGITFAEVDLSAGGVSLKARNTKGQPRRAFIVKQGTGWQYLEPLQTAPPIPAGVIGVHPALPALPFHQRLGVHMLGSGKPQLDDWIRAGCKSFTVIDNVLAAREARAAGAAVVFRRFIQHGSIPGPRDFVKFMGLHPSDTVMIMGVNEADNISTSAIEQRFAWDVEFARAVWDIYPRCFPVIGSWSMGTPQLENPDVARRFRDTYGKFLNENWHRVGLNYHGYSGRPDASFPPQHAGVVTPEWLEMRFLKYAYDPSFGALDKRVLLTNDESGVDQQGTGGFPACGYDEATFKRWWQMRRGLYEPHPQQYTFNIFQVDTTSQKWAGYNARPFMGPLQQIWAG